MKQLKDKHLKLIAQLGLFEKSVKLRKPNQLRLANLRMLYIMVDASLKLKALNYDIGDYESLRKFIVDDVINGQGKWLTLMAMEDLRKSQVNEWIACWQEIVVFIENLISELRAANQKTLFKKDGI